MRSIIGSLPTCQEVTGMTVDECVDCVSNAAARMRRGWLQAIGAPDYRAYLAHHAQRHPDASPMTERDFVNFFIERRYNRPGAGRCC